MSDSTKKPLSRDPYKGTRDFYPEDMARLKWLFQKMRETCELYGYVEYTASPLESTELYAAKSGEEIVNEQTYSFIDRGGRNVTLRPEMTPTVARMVAARKRELPFPLRWYSIPNLFRYEQPQRGRLREHYQLNVDIFGVKGLEGEIEVISLGHNLLLNLGAQEKDFKIKINNRAAFELLIVHWGLNEEEAYKLSKLIDKKAKISVEVFRQELSKVAPHKFEEIMTLLNSQDLASFCKNIPDNLQNQKAFVDMESVLSGLKTLGITNVIFDPTLMRGFDYYTGIVFEFFDTNPANSRSLFGGGRYDELLAIFDEETVPAIGFGMGDVTALDFLETHKLLTPYISPVKLYLCKTDTAHIPFITNLARVLRESGVTVGVDLSTKKLGDQIKLADKQHIPFVICIGEEETKEQIFTLKELATGKEIKGDIKKIITALNK
jgi:histidyl-tRNA synthetase